MFLKILQNILENVCTRVSFWRPATLLKQDSGADVFCVFAKSLGTSILLNICERLLLKKEASTVRTRSEACQNLGFCYRRAGFLVFKCLQ